MVFIKWFSSNGFRLNCKSPILSETTLQIILFNETKCFGRGLFFLLKVKMPFLFEENFALYKVWYFLNWRPKTFNFKQTTENKLFIILSRMFFKKKYKDNFQNKKWAQRAVFIFIVQKLFVICHHFMFAFYSLRFFDTRVWQHLLN